MTAGSVIVTAAAWSLALLAVFLRWGGPACLPWPGHREGRPLVAAAHVGATMVLALVLATRAPDAIAAATFAVLATIAGSWGVSAALRSRRTAMPSASRR